MNNQLIFNISDDFVSQMGADVIRVQVKHEFLDACAGRVHPSLRGQPHGAVFPRDIAGRAHTYGMFGRVPARRNGHDEIEASVGYTPRLHREESDGYFPELSGNVHPPAHIAEEIPAIACLDSKIGL